MLLRGCNVVTSWEIVVDLLTHPTTGIDASFGVSEAPFQIRHCAGIGRLLGQIGGVGEVDLAVGSTCC